MKEWLIMMLIGIILGCGGFVALFVIGGIVFVGWLILAANAENSCKK